MHGTGLKAGEFVNLTLFSGLHGLKHFLSKDFRMPKDLEHPQRDHYDAIVIGGGAGGMVSAFYLAREGKKVLLVEKNQEPMGSAWCKTVRGYTFEETIHFYAGTEPEGPIGKFCRDLEPWYKMEWTSLDPYYRLIGPWYDITINSKVEETRAQLIALAPEDKDFINDVIDTALEWGNSVAWPRMPKRWLGLSEYMRMIWPMRRVFGKMLKYRKVSLMEACEKWMKSLKLKHFFYSILNGPEQSFTVVIAHFAINMLNRSMTPVNGTHEWFRGMMHAVRELGSEVVNRREVKKIIHDGEKASGVIMDDDTKISSDVIISNMDRLDTYNMLLGMPDIVKEEYDEHYHYPLGYGFNSVNLGVKGDITKEQTRAHCVRINMHEPLLSEKDQKPEERILSVRFTHQSTPQVAPPGNSVVILTEVDFYDNWEQHLKDDGEYHGRPYRDDKQAFADRMIDGALRVVPDLRERIDYMDTSTPLSVKKWTTARRGTGIGGYAQTPKMVTRFLSEESKMKNLYFAGQWATGRAGMPACVTSGRATAALVLNKKSLLTQD